MPSEGQSDAGEEENPLVRPRSPFSEYQRKMLNKKLRKEQGQGPDGLLAWIIAFANFLIILIVVGLGRMSGILYVVFMNTFGIDRKVASIPFSVQQATRNLFGPLTGILGQKYGVRSVTVAGGIIGVISAVTCYFTTDMNWIIVMWGLVFGICTAFTTTLNQVPIDQYFEKNRTTAGGFAFSGGCIGAFFFPVVLEALLARYGISGTFLAMAGMILIVVPAALILEEPPWKKKRVQFSEKHEDIEESAEENKLNYKTFNAIAPPAISQEQNAIPINFDYLYQNCELVYQLFLLTFNDTSLTDYPLEILCPSFNPEPLVKELEDIYKFVTSPPTVNQNLSEIGSVVNELTHNIHVIEITSHESTDQSTTDACADHSKDDYENNPNSLDFRKFDNHPRWIFIVGKLHQLCEETESDVLSCFHYDAHVHIQEVLESINTINAQVKKFENTEIKEEVGAPTILPDMDSEGQNVNSKRLRKRSAQHVKDSNSFWVHIQTAIRLHKNPLFLLICLCRGVFMLTFIPMTTIVVDFVIDKGLNSDTGKYVIATLSLGDLLGRLCLGWITDIGYLSLSRYMLVVMVLLSCSTASLPFMHSEVTMFPAILIFGMLQGSLFVRHQILVSKYMGSHEQSIGMGFINLLSGFLGFSLPYYIGYFRDTRGSYDGMFFVNGVICAFVGLLWMLEPYFVRFSSKHKSHEYEKL